MSRLTQQGVKDRDNASPLLALLYTMALGLTSLPQVKHHLEQVLNLKMLTMEEEVLCGGGSSWRAAPCRRWGCSPAAVLRLVRCALSRRDG